MAEVPVEGQSKTGKEMDRRKNRHESIFEYLTTGAHLVVGIFVIIILYFCCTNELVLFTWHPLLLAIGWVLLMTEGLLSLCSENTLTKRLSHKVKVQFHWIIQLTAVTLGLLGFIVVYVNKNLLEKAHFSSWHGLVGLISTIACLPASGTGIFALYSTNFKSRLKPANVKFVHILCGIVTFAAGSVTVLLSLYTNWFRRNASHFLVSVVIILLFPVMMWSIRQPLCKVLRKVHTCSMTNN